MMKTSINDFEARKREHVSLALSPENVATECHVFDTVILKHEAMPDLDRDDINISSHRFGKSVSNPFIISSMTAGHKDALRINRHLMEAASCHDWAMGVGSQRRELFDKEAFKEWQSLRRDFPDIILFSNIGLAQLIETPLAHILALTQNIQAAALIIHCNPLQEMIQPEGTPFFKGCWQALERLIATIDMPVIVKETGCGFSRETLIRLNAIGVSAVDVSGLGGTHWGRIEGARAGEGSIAQKTANVFKYWGINTVQCVKEAVSLNPSFEVWGSGGVRHGLDAAKLFALGATTVGFAKPLLEAALHSAQAVKECMTAIEYALKVAMFCTGSRVIHELKGKICL